MIGALSRLAMVFGIALCGWFALAERGIKASAAVEPVVDVRFEAFRDVCVDDRHDYAALQIRVLAEGWRPAGARDHPELEALLGRSAALELAGDAGASLESYGKPVGTTNAYLVLTHLVSEQIDLVGCFLYDFAAAEPIDPDIISAWIGAAPSDTVDQPDVIIGHSWNAPESLPGTWDVYLAFLPEGSAAAAEAGVSGIGLRITWGDREEE